MVSREYISYLFPKLLGFLVPGSKMSGGPTAQSDVVR